MVMKWSWFLVLLLFFVLFLFVFVTQVYASIVPLNIDMIRLQKQQMFGFNYQGNYKQWFGFRGYGYGFEVGNVGVVYGMKRSDVGIKLPDWLFGYDEYVIDGVKYKEQKMLSLGTLYIDGFTYVYLDGFNAYGFRDISKWLFWELSVWFAK